MTVVIYLTQIVWLYMILSYKATQFRHNYLEHYDTKVHY
jgi:hypothetical protein